MQSLVIVMDCFSDVELLCDLLEASRKRNVSVHLLLDHLNLSLFVSMWQGLKLSSKNFPVSSLSLKKSHPSFFLRKQDQISYKYGIKVYCQGTFVPSGTYCRNVSAPKEGGLLINILKTQHSPR